MMMMMMIPLYIVQIGMYISFFLINILLIRPDCTFSIDNAAVRINIIITFDDSSVKNKKG
jgi:hypothetical protein